MKHMSVFCVGVVCAIFIVACGSEPKLKGHRVLAGGATYLFISYDEDLEQAFNDSFRNLENGKTWYRIDFTTAQLQSSPKHRIDLAHNTDTGVTVSGGDGVLRLGPTPTSNVRVLDGTLMVEKRLTYHMVPACFPTYVVYRVALNAEYEKTISAGGESKTVKGTIHLDRIDILTDEELEGC